MIKATGTTKVAEALQPKSAPPEGKGGPIDPTATHGGKETMTKTGPTLKGDGDPGIEKSATWPSQSESSKIGKIS